MRIISLSLLTTALLGTALSASALTAQQIVEKEAVTISEDGSERLVRTAADKITPGERIVYRLVYTNDDAEPATDLVLTMPVPSEVAFIEGTETSGDGVTVTYSADAGKTFTGRNALKVTDDSGEVREAGALDITHLRWNVSNTLPVGGTGELSFSGVIK